MMNESSISAEAKKAALAQCESLDHIVPSFYYNIQQLKRIVSKFEQNPDLKQAEALLLALHDLDDKMDNPEQYIYQYRESLTRAIKHMNEFINTLKQPEALSSLQQHRLLNVVDELTRIQQAMLEKII